MRACFDNYIQIRAACTPITLPTSGLFIDDLPGITLKKAAHSTEDFERGKDLLDRCVEQGIIRVREKLVGDLLGTVLFNSALSTGRYGRFEDDIDLDSNYLAVNAANRGLKVELSECCRLTALQVKRVRVLVNTAGDHTLTITDGIVETTYSFTAVAKVPVYVETNYTANSEQLKITLDNTAISVNNSTLNQTGTCGFCDNDCTGSINCSCNSGLSIWGWDGSQETGLSYGLSAVIHVICSEERFFCEISNFDSVKQAVWYESGVVFLDHLLSTDRLNVFTNYGEEEKQERREKWENLVEEKITKLINQLPKYLSQVCPDCLECNSSHWNHQMP